MASKAPNDTKKKEKERPSKSVTIIEDTSSSVAASNSVEAVPDLNLAALKVEDDDELSSREERPSSGGDKNIYRDTPRTPLVTPRTPREVVIAARAAAESQGAHHHSAAHAGYGDHWAKGASHTHAHSAAAASNTRGGGQGGSNKLDEATSNLFADIDPQYLYLMRDGFTKYGGAVNQYEFVEVMMQCVAHSHEGDARSKLVSRLCDIFDQIDINGDKEVSWEEFTNYIANHGVIKDGSNSLAVRIKRYEECPVAPRIRFSSLERIKYFAKLDRVVICDRTEVVRLYTPSSRKYRDAFVLESPKELYGHRGPVLNCEYIADTNHLITSSADNVMLLWDCTASKFKARSKLMPLQPQYALAWSSDNRKLYSAGMSGDISVWNLDTAKSIATFVGHQDMVLDLKEIVNLPIIASASLDTQILLWDTNTARQLHVLAGHEKGVFGLAYAPDYKLLASASFERDVFLWNPITQSLIGKLKGHQASLVNVLAVAGTPRLISADKNGIMKLWDVRNFECVQTFTAPAVMHGLADFTHAHDTILAATARSLHCFQYDKPGKPWRTHDTAIVACIYNAAAGTILTAAGRDVKIWDPDSGAVLHNLHNIVGSDITSVCIDSRGKKFFIGESDGHVKLFNYNTGIYINHMESHQAEVSALLYSGLSNNVISASWDSRVFLHDEQGCDISRKKSVLRNIKGNLDQDVTCAAISDNLSLIASGCLDNTVRVWDFYTCAFEYAFKHDAEITATMFLDPYPLLVTADSAGCISFWGVRPAADKHRLLLRIVNKSSHLSDSGPGSPTPVNVMRFSGLYQVWVLGDEMGMVKAYSLKEFLTNSMMTPVSAKLRASKAVASRGNSAGASSRDTDEPKSDPNAGVGMGHMSGAVGSTIRGSSPPGSSGGKRASERADSRDPDRSTAERLGASSFNADHIKLIHEWHAHKKTVTTLDLIYQAGDELNVLSGGLDKRVRMWDLKGSYYGTLRQAAGGRWRFPNPLNWEEDARKAKRIENVIERIEKGAQADDEEPAWFAKQKKKRSAVLMIHDETNDAAQRRRNNNTRALPDLSNAARLREQAPPGSMKVFNELLAQSRTPASSMDRSSMVGSSRKGALSTTLGNPGASAAAASRSTSPGHDGGGGSTLRPPLQTDAARQSMGSRGPQQSQSLFEFMHWQQVRFPEPLWSQSQLDAALALSRALEETYS